MSTRTRIVLRCPGFEAIGSFAVKSLIELANSNGLMNFQFPRAWKRMTKREKLAWLAGKLPAKYKLELFQEPRGTRIKQSLYHASLAFKQQKRRHPQNPHVKGINNWGAEVANIGIPVQPPLNQVHPPDQMMAEDEAFPEERIYRDFEEAPIMEEEI